MSWGWWVLVGWVTPGIVLTPAIAWWLQRQRRAQSRRATEAEAAEIARRRELSRQSAVRPQSLARERYESAYRARQESRR